MPVLVKRGHRGPYVRDIQSQLNLNKTTYYSSYPPLVVDGIYGKNTRRRVEEFQYSNPPLKVDGIVGPNTWAKLFPSPSSPATTAPVPPASPPETGPPEPAVLYVHAHDAPGKNATGSIHQSMEVHHVVVPNGKAGESPAMMKAVIERENIVLTSLVINTHGGGAGRIKIGGQFVHLGQQPRFFKGVQGHLAPQAIVWIYACAFATATRPLNDGDAWLVSIDEIRHGEGIKAVQSVARYLQREVRAGFGMQFGDMSGFTGCWVSADPSGEYKFHAFGRLMNPQEYVNMWNAQINALPGATVAAYARMKEWIVGK